MRHYRSVTVSVDVDMAEIGTKDLVEELQSRTREEPSPLHEIYYAFKFGLSDRATELARAYVCDELGVVL